MAEQVWYPLWDSGARLDHSVRTMPEMVAAAEADLKVALGLLDVRHLAGDPHLTLRLRTTMLANWRRTAKERLPALKQLVWARHETVGEVAHLSVPDIKEAEGGLRDATVLKALVATWLVDVPHADLERSRQALLDVRDVVQGLAGRATDRVAPEAWDGLAAGLGLADAASAQRHVRELGRRVAHLSRLTWRRAEGVLARPAAAGVRRPVLTPLGPGVALSAGEVVLDRRARPAEDPSLLLRACALAAERDALLAPSTAARLARETAPLAEPWPDEARHLLVRLLASGRGLLPVWETLEETGALARVLPEWERIRLLPHASAIHRWTVDRHSVQTCVEAAGLIREVARPDVLAVAALLHDIGKGGPTDHSEAGEPVARGVAARMGFGDDVVDLVARLVRHHLLLVQAATTRDPADPATAEAVATAVGSREALALLTALTEADARATAPQAWTSWRAGLVQEVARRTAAVLDPAARPAGPTEELALPEGVQPGRVTLLVQGATDGARVTVAAPDRVGLLADAAGALALGRLRVRSARAWSRDGLGISVWEVAAEQPDPAVLRQRYDAVVAGRVDPAQRLRAVDPDGLAPAVVVRPGASRRATVLEVRTGDRPGVVHRVCAALAGAGITVRSAHVDTLGPQAVDVFYLQDDDARPLSPDRADRAADAVRAALGSASR